jgi:quercetin dioxygenase-like cupin family protein
LGFQSGQVRVIRRASADPPTREAIESILASEALTGYTWSNAPGDRYTSHQHSYGKIIYVVKGSITFGLTGTGETIGLRSGDRLEIPAGTRHDATVGPKGVECIEAHR